MIERIWNYPGMIHTLEGHPEKFGAICLIFCILWLIGVIYYFNWYYKSALNKGMEEYMKERCRKCRFRYWKGKIEGSD